MQKPLVLASGSAIRRQLFENAGVDILCQPARIDEVAVVAAMTADQAAPADIAGTLAALKAQKSAGRNPEATAIGCDQVLALGRRVFAKPGSGDDARQHLADLSGQTHALYSAAVIFEDGREIWRHVGHVRLTMHTLSPSFIDAYVARNWDSIRHAVGCYLLEAEGARLFSRIDGDYFNVLGLPLLQILSYLTLRGNLPI